MLTVCGKITAAQSSSTGKSVSVLVGGTWVHVATEDLAAFKDAIGTGKPVEVRIRSDVVLDDDGSLKLRSFKKRDGSTGTGPDIRSRIWFRVAKITAGLEGLLGTSAVAGTADPDEPQA